MSRLLRRRLLRCRGSLTAVPQHAGPVAGLVRIAPQFESFYTFPVKDGFISTQFFQFAYFWNDDKVGLGV